jgi:TctA family transporter
MSFGLYALGYFVVIIGVAYMAHLMHIPQQWIVAIVIVLFGVGITSAVQSTRRRDPR